MIQPRCLGKSSGLRRCFLIECIAVIEMGAETWKMSFRPPPRKRPSGMCGCRCHVWAENWHKRGTGGCWGVGNGLPGNSPKKWAKSKGGVLKCMLGTDVLCILGLWLKTQGGRHPCLSLSLSLSLSLWTYLRWTWDSYTVRSSDMQT